MNEWMNQSINQSINLLTSASGAKIEDAECYVEGDEADSDQEGEVIHVDVVVELLYTFEIQSFIDSYIH